MNCIEIVRDIASKQLAIAHWQSDHAGHETKTSLLLRDSAKWLEELSRHMCCCGYIGCKGGPNCTSDHK